MKLNVSMKRVLSFLMALVMVLGMLPAGGLPIHAHATHEQVVYIDCRNVDLSDASYITGTGWVADARIDLKELILCEPYSFFLQYTDILTMHMLDGIIVDNGAHMMLDDRGSGEGEILGMIWVQAKNGTIISGIYGDDCLVVVEEQGRVSGGTFYGGVENHGTIVGGTITCTLVNEGEISGYTNLNGFVYNYGTIINKDGELQLGENFRLSSDSTGTIICESHIWKDGSCRLCSEACTHQGHSQTGCGLCGLTEGIHSYDETTHSCDCGLVEEFTITILDIRWDSEIGRITAPYGSDISAQVAEIVEAVNQQDPGYTFYCWMDSKSRDKVQLTTMPGKNMTVVTVVTFLNFDIFYYANGEVYHTGTASYTNAYMSKEPKTAPTREGYTFTGWVYYSSYDAETGVFSDEYTGTGMANHPLYANAQWDCLHEKLEYKDNGDWETHDAVCGDCGELIEAALPHEPGTAEFRWPESDNGYMDVRVGLNCACGYEVDYTYADVEMTEFTEGVDCSNPGSATYTATAEFGGETYHDTKTYPVPSENHTALDENGFCACGGYQSAYYNEETGVYEIGNAGQLYWYAQQLNEYNAEIYVKLTADITIPENAPNWQPISSSYAYFDGNFKTISGLKCIGGDAQYVGLFGREGWWYEISNLHITDSYFEGSANVGAVVAELSNGGSVTNCYVTNTTVTSDGYSIGGLVGSLSIGNVINCYTDSNALVGYRNTNYGSIENSYYLSAEETEDGGKTAAQFASGEVAFLLQAGQQPGYDYDEEGNGIEVPAAEIWGQNIGVDEFPVLGGQKVYQGYGSCADRGYTNSPNPSPERPDHSGEIKYTPNADGTTHSGVCSCCGEVVTESESHSFNQFSCCQLCGYQCAHGSYTNHHCRRCGAPETFAITLNQYSVGAAIVGNPVATYGQDLTIELENTASETRDEVRVCSVKIAGQYVYDQTIMTNTLTIPGEKVVGDVELYLQAGYVTVQVDLAGGTLLRNYAEWFRVENGIATLRDEQAFIHNVLIFGSRLVRPGYALVSLTDAEGNDWRNKDILLERDIYLTAKWECLHEGEKTYVVNGDGTHDCFCANGCVLEDDVPHSYDEATLLCGCGQAHPDAVVLVSMDGTPVCAFTDVNAATDNAEQYTAEDKAVLKLLKSVDLGVKNVLIFGGVFTLDLNGFTLTSSAYDSGAVCVYNESDVTICNGTIVGGNNCLQLNTGKVIVSDVTCLEAICGIKVNNCEVILRRCDIQTENGILFEGGSVAVYDSTIDTNRDFDNRGDGTVTFHEGTKFPGGLSVSDVSLENLLPEGMAYWQGNTMYLPDEDVTDICGDVTVKAACTHENSTVVYIPKDLDSHLVACSDCRSGHTEPHSPDEEGKCTICGFDPTKFITINMTDNYGDGWNGNAIQIYEDGVLLDTTTCYVASTATWVGAYNPEKEYEFRWVKGNYPDECSFELIIPGETVFTVAVGACSHYPDGYRFFPVCSHVYDEGVVTAPSCMGQGYTIYTCTLCGLSYEDDRKESLGGHKKAEGDEGAVIPPTCTSEGYTIYTCAVCGESFDDDFVNKAGHVLGEDGGCAVCGNPYSVHVWVADTQITGDNMADILGDGTASFDPATKTLTLNGYRGGEIYMETPLNIRLLGENTIETEEYGIFVNCRTGAVSISGTGSLDIISQYESVYTSCDSVTMTIGGSVTLNLMTGYEGINLEADDTAELVIRDNATVIIGTEEAPLEEECIYVDSDITGSVTITGNASVTCITNYEESIDVDGEDAYLTVSGNANVYAVTEDEGLDVEFITISGGTVTAIGGDDYEGIYTRVLTVSGGTVTAEGGDQGIEAENIIITGGTVTVTGGMIASVEATMTPGTITLGEGMGITAPKGAALGELDMNAEGEGFVLAVLDSDGTLADTVIITAVESPIRITQQPAAFEGLLGESAAFTVEAEGENLSYQWYYYNTEDEQWKKSYSPGSTTDTVSPVFYAYRDGQQYRCVITDSQGNSVTSKIAVMTLKTGDLAVTGNSGDVTGGALGKTYTFSVSVTGDNLTYLWEVSTDGGETWNQTWLSGYNTNTLTVKFNANRNGNLYRCVITAAGKESITSEPMGLYLQAESAQIVGQPENVKVLSGKTATFTVVATGNDLTYAWYRSDDRGTTWTKTYLPGYDTDTLSFEANLDRAAMYLCKVTDGSGKTVCSEQAALSILPEILTQPANFTCGAGQTAAFVVAARGENLRYQWYYSADGGETWTKSYLSGYNTDTLFFMVNEARASRIYKCVITDCYGDTVETVSVSVTMD